MADSGRLVKVEVDCTDIVDEKLPEYRKLAEVKARGQEISLLLLTFVQNGKVNDALEGLLSLEKQTRMVTHTACMIVASLLCNVVSLYWVGGWVNLHRANHEQGTVFPLIKAWASDISGLSLYMRPVFIYLT